MSFFRRKYIVFIFVMISTSAAVYAQVYGDVNDRLYDLLELWYEHGYIKKLPLVQPYPLTIIVKLLDEVTENAPEPDSSIASGYIDFFGKGTEEEYRMIHLRANTEYIANGWDVYGNNVIEGIANGTLGDLVDYSGKANFGLKVLPNTELFPMYETVKDEGKSGGADIDIQDRSLEIDVLYQGVFFVGVENLYLRAGFMRSAFGPEFENNAILAPECYTSGHVSLEWDIGWFSYTSVLLDLRGKYWRDVTDGSIESIPGPVNKYLVLQNLGFYPYDFLNFGFVQSIVSNQLKFTYIIPFQNLMYSQLFYGEYDNSMIGAYAQVRLPYSVEIDSLLYIDDFSFDRFTGIDGGIPFNLDSAQNKLALQAGITWSPCTDPLRSMGITYTLVTPYMYTHINRGGSYDLTYTNEETHIGSSLEPNSDELVFKYTLSPFRLFDAEIKARYVRHGNASEGTTVEKGDGSVYDEGYDTFGNATYLGPSRFLTQSTLEHTLQVSIDLFTTFFIFDSIKIDAGIGYMFEHVWNWKLASGNDRIQNLISLSLFVMY